MRERWQRLGFDDAAADERSADLSKRLLSASDDAADVAIVEWSRTEREFALAQGVPEADPDLWRIAAAVKHIRPRSFG